MSAALLSDEIEVNVRGLSLVPIRGFHEAIKAAQQRGGSVIEQATILCDVPLGPELEVGENITRIALASDVLVLRTGRNVVVMMNSPYA